jgi:hypothetical protein
MINRIVESKFKAGKVITTFSAFGSYLNESEYTSDGYKVKDYDPQEVLRNIRRAILWLTINRGFYGELLAHVNIYGSDDVPTMCTNGRDIVFGPHFVLELSKGGNIKPLIFVLAHEILHCIGEHAERRGNRDPRGWNIACDLAINPILKSDDQLEFPTKPNGELNGLYEERFDGMRAEDIYDTLLEEGKLPKMLTNKDIEEMIKRMGEVQDEDEEFPEPDEETIAQDVNLEDEDEDDYDDEESEDEDEESEDDDEEELDDEDLDDEDDEDEEEMSDEEAEAEAEKEQQEKEKKEKEKEEQEKNKPKAPPRPAKSGDIIQRKSGGYGKIVDVNDDGTYEVEEISKEEVKKYFDDNSAEYDRID